MVGTRGNWLCSDVICSALLHSVCGTDEHATFRNLMLFFLSFHHCLVLYTSVFHRSISDSESHQLARTLLGILVDLDNAVVWIVSIFFLPMEHFPKI